MSVNINRVHLNVVIDEHSYKFSCLTFDCVMESIATKFITLKAVYSTLLQCLVDTSDDVLVRMTIVRILSQNMEQVLSLFILLAYYGIICCFRDQSQEELELCFIECILHCKHVVVPIVENKVRNTLLTSLDSDSEARSRRSFWLNFFFWLRDFWFIVIVVLIESIEASSKPSNCSLFHRRFSCECLSCIESTTSIEGILVLHEVLLHCASMTTY